MTPTDIIETLLALVAPKCGICARPATTNEREPAPQEMCPGRYRCDLHPCSEGRWQDLPGAATIRAAMALVESAIDPEKYARDRKRIAEARELFIADNRGILSTLADRLARAQSGAAPLVSLESAIERLRKPRVQKVPK